MLGYHRPLYHAPGIDFAAEVPTMKAEEHTLINKAGVGYTCSCGKWEQLRNLVGGPKKKLSASQWEARAQRLFQEHVRSAARK